MTDTPTPPPTPAQLEDLVDRATRHPLTYPEANRLRAGIRRLAEQRDTLIETLAQARRTAGGQQAAMDKLRRQAKNAETETETLRAGFRAIGGDPTRVQNLQAQLTMTVRLRKHAEAERDRYRAAWRSARRRATQGRQQADREHADALARLRDGRRRDGVAARISQEALQQQIAAQAREIDRRRDQLAALRTPAHCPDTVRWGRSVSAANGHLYLTVQHDDHTHDAELSRDDMEDLRVMLADLGTEVYEAQLVTELTARLGAEDTTPQPGYSVATLRAVGARPSRYAALKRAAQAAHHLDTAAGRIHL